MCSVSFLVPSINCRCALADHAGDFNQRVALFGVHGLRGVRGGQRPWAAVAMRRLRHQLSHLLPGPAATHRAQGRLEVQMVGSPVTQRALQTFY